MKKAIITVVGKDTVGIIAKVCVYLAENNVNILDISQTIVDGYFNMMMVVDVTNVAFDQICYSSLNNWHYEKGIIAFLHDCYTRFMWK